MDFVLFMFAGAVISVGTLMVVMALPLGEEEFKDETEGSQGYDDDYVCPNCQRLDNVGTHSSTVYSCTAKRPSRGY